MEMNKKGFSLMELVVVMVIIAIGAVLVVPNMGAWLPNYRLRSAARDIVSTMRVAQMKAVSNNMDYQVTIVGETYKLERDSGGLVTEGETKTLPTGITFSGNTFLNPSGHARFKPNSSSNGGTLRLQNTKGTEREIRVLPSTGRITVQ